MTDETTKEKQRMIEEVEERILHDIEKADLLAKAYDRMGDVYYVAGYKDAVDAIKAIIKGK